jgi:hypothetical protein
VWVLNVLNAKKMGTAGKEKYAVQKENVSIQ